MIVDILNSIVASVRDAGLIGVIISTLLISVESILPVIPLAVFITVDYIILGKVLGFFVSYIFTILGCVASYFIFKKGFGNKFENLTENKELLKKYKHMFRNISTGKLVLLTSFPFTPAFMINIAAGLVKMDFKKFMTAMLIGKISLVIFEATVGTSVIESINNPIILIKILIMLVASYIVYLIVKKIFKIDN